MLFNDSEGRDMTRRDPVLGMHHQQKERKNVNNFSFSKNMHVGENILSALLQCGSC